MSKTKGLNEAKLLELLQKVLAEVTKDQHLANTIYNAVAKEVNLIKSLQSFEKFCETGSMPDAEPQTVANLQDELTTKFGEGAVTVTADEKGEALEVEINLPDRTVATKVKIMSEEQAAAEAVEAPFVPFPVALPHDPGLVWVLGRRENFGPDEATRALERIQEEFWQTKKGQTLQQKGVEKTFAEFIVEVPASALAESGLKRHYKTPEALHTLRLQGGGAGASLEMLGDSLDAPRQQRARNSNVERADEAEPAETEDDVDAREERRTEPREDVKETVDADDDDADAREEREVGSSESVEGRAEEEEALPWEH